ncbi:MAG: hypothetical protein K2N36_09275, partial [Ruminiclostridium sp.]|nr:hypothetical protein [Ruminiclostridium sp.]
MAWNEAAVTAAGMELLARSLIGGNVVITRAAGGESVSAALSLTALKSIKEPCHELNLFRVEKGNGKIIVNLRAQNKGVREEYALRQIGLFARLEGDNNDVLFAVIQDSIGENIPKESDNPDFLTEFDFVIAVANSEKISVEITPNTFVTSEDMAEVEKEIGGHISDKENPHGVTKAQVGLGNVPDVATNDQTPTYAAAAKLGELVSGEKLSGAFGKIAKAVKELITHLADNVRHITAAERTAWNGKAAGDHTHSNMKGASSDAAGAAGLVPAPAAGSTARDFLSAAGTWRSPFRSGDESAGQNLDDCKKGGVYFFVGNAMPENAPVSGAGWLMTLENSSNYVKQLWFRLSSSVIYVRACSNGTWSDWKQLALSDEIKEYSSATTAAAGLMSTTDKKKLDGIAEEANKYVHPTTAGNKHIPSGGSAGQFLKWGADGTAVWAEDNNTTYSNMKGASSDAAGTAGLVPAPPKGDIQRFLRSTGEWGHVFSPEYVPSGADLNDYKIPGIYYCLSNRSFTNIPSGVSNGWLFVTYSDSSYVKQIFIRGGGTSSYFSDVFIRQSDSGIWSAWHKFVTLPSDEASKSKYLRGDGTWQTPPDTNAAYSLATQSANGLMSADDKKKLDGLSDSSNSIVSIVQGTTGAVNSISINIPTGAKKALVEFWTYTASTTAKTSYGSAFWSVLSGTLPNQFLIGTGSTCVSCSVLSADLNGVAQNVSIDHVTNISAKFDVNDNY